MCIFGDFRFHSYLILGGDELEHIVVTDTLMQ